MNSIASVACGADLLLDDDSRLQRLRGARVAVLANPTSVTRRYEHIVDELLGRRVPIVRLFGPEHGLRGEAQDMIAVEQVVDPISGLPTVSLYAHSYDSLAPPTGSLDDVDVLIIDLQDVGARYYTYVYTAMLAAEAATKAGVDVWLLDRPNPIGGTIEGPSVQTGCRSFVGMLPMPNRHGLTVAEVLRLARLERELEFDVIEVGGWNRELWFDQTDAPWVLPSPNMPTLDTAVVYPGMCLLEGTNLSEGRGTTRPFEIFGAPYVDPAALRLELERLSLPGVVFRYLSFEPTFQKWARSRCSGLGIHVVDRDAFLPLRTGAAIVWACRRLFEDFAWRSEAYEFVDDVPAIDLLFGSPQVREAIDNKADFDEVAALLATPDSLCDTILDARLEGYSA